MKIAFGADHGGFEYKKILMAYAKELGYEPVDFGCSDTTSVDYPDYAQKACKAVVCGECERAVLVCGTGIGMSIAANKVAHIKCALCGDTVSAALTRAHNDTNALAMGARIIGIEVAKAIMRTWLETKFEGGRHAQRLQKIDEIERCQE